MAQNEASKRRIPIIIRGIRDGLSYEVIGNNCKPPVHRTTIYRDRKGIPFKDFFNDLADEYLTDLAKLRKSGDSKDKRFALRQKGQFIKAMTRAIIPTRIEAKVEHGPMNITLLISDTLEALPPEEETES